MNTRSADATIKGYYYQFDTSILKLLALKNDSDAITIEGIEDIDISTATDLTTVQCKYLSKPNFINSAVREPIILMIEHFLNPSTQNNLKYILYAHFENETAGNEPTIDLAKLKDILTYKVKKVKKHYEKEKSISDAQLNAFLAQFKLVFGTEFQTQQKQIIDKFKTEFSCSDLEADIHFYNNALRVVIDKAIKKKTNQRILTKKEFLTSINCVAKLFNEWFIKLRSKQDYLKLLNQSLKNTNALDPARVKTIIIGDNIVSADNSQLPLCSFIENLIAKYYRINSCLRTSKTLTVIIDCDNPTLQQVKECLIDNEIIFNDGFEGIKFSSVIFNKDPIVNKTANGAKITKSSYLIKLISLETFMKNKASISAPRVLINFSKKDITNFSNGQFFDIKYCDNLNEVYKLLI